jgi:HlyD family secretion protein
MVVVVSPSAITHGMDIERKNLPKRRYKRWTRIGGFSVVLGALVVLGGFLSRRPAAVSGENIWRGEVSRSQFVREISASGTLTAPELRAVTNRSEGVVERVLVQPGRDVEVDTVLMELSSPQLKQDLSKARVELSAAEAEYKLSKIDSENRDRDITADLASAQSEFTGAELELQAKERIPGIISKIELEQIRLRTKGLEKRLEAQQARSDSFARYRSALDSAASARLEQVRQQVSQLDGQLQDLKVRAGSRGVVQEINVQEGERVALGQAVARVVNPNKLIAQVRVSERDASLVRLGQPAHLNVGTETVEGSVIRVDPTVRDQFVIVDVKLLPSELQASLRPDLSVTARIELERVNNALVLDRPVALTGEFRDIDLYRVDKNSDNATRVRVSVGRASARQVEVLRGLTVGDEVILSDLPEFKSQPVIRIH